MEKTLLLQTIKEKLKSTIDLAELKDMVTIEVPKENLFGVCQTLRDDDELKFELLLDICGVDYSDYGYTHWRTEETTESGFSRGVNVKGKQKIIDWDKPRFGVVYHLLSITHNHRIRIKVYLSPEPFIPSVMGLWASADWYEREAFDLYGIVFEGHPDLRRLLTDYGFSGHPFRKDFPLIGEVEMRYDATEKRCIYEPVSINPRVLVPKVIREDSRYLHTEKEEGNPNA